MNNILMPDILPHQFASWLDFYFDVVSIAQTHGFETNEDLVINVAEYLTTAERDYIKEHYNENIVAQMSRFPFNIIKARAFDELIKTIPSQSDIQQLLHLAMVNRVNGDVISSLDKLLFLIESISPGRTIRPGQV